MPTKPGIIYRMEWKTVENNSMRIDIKDASVQIDSIIGEEQVIPLQASGDPLHISITDNDENKFTPIRAKKATIKFLNSTEINFLTFASGEDDRFPVTITCDTNIIFLGFLQQGDIREPFLFQEAQEVVLTAVDGLAFLKNLLLVDYKGDPVSGVHTIIDYIAFSLLRTGLQLNINVFNNIREQNSPGRWKTIATFTAPHTWTVPLPGYTNINQLNFFKVGNVVSITGSASNNGIKVITSVIDTGGGTAQIVTSDTITNEASGPLINFEDVSDGGCWYSTCRLDAKTFEADIGVSEDCDTILRKILGHDSFIEQYLGEWYIFRVKELRNDFQQYRTLYDFSGAFQNFTSGYNLQQAIGLKDITGTPFPVAPDAVSFFSKEATTRTISRPNGNVKLIYNYVQPKELPCNVDFSNGGFIADLPDETIDGLVNQAKSYDLGCWTIERDFPSSGVDFNAYVKKLFYNGYEKQRFAVLEKPVSTAGGHFRFIRSESIPINIKDKFTWAFDYRASVDTGGAGAQIGVGATLLYGDDGSYWVLGDTGGVQWKLSDVNFSVNFDVYQWSFAASDDITQWGSFNIEAPPAPVGGNIYFILFASPNTISEVRFDVYYQNLNFDYIPFINGSYSKYSGQYFKSTRAGNYKDKIEEEVFVSNCPTKISKGSLQRVTAAGFKLVDRFYDGQEFFYPDDGNNNLYAFGDLQVRAFHNQYRNSDQVYELTAQGLSAYNNAPDLIHRMYDRDSEPSTNNNTLQLVWIDQDWKRNEWKGTMIKNFDANIGFVFDTVEFKYITE